MLGLGSLPTNVESEATVKLHPLLRPVGELGIGRWLQSLLEEYY